MSILRKAVLGLALTVSVSGAAMANDPILNFGGSPAAISFTAVGNGGTLAANTNVVSSFIAGIVPPGTTAAKFVFTSNMINGSAVPLGASGAVALFGPGSFAFINDDISDVLYYGQTILAGSFQSGVFTATPVFSGNQAISFLTSDVNYDGTGYAESAFNALYYSPLSFPLQGSMGLTFTAAVPTVSGTFGGGLSSFNAQVSGNLDAVKAVPEPGEWAAMGILASGLTGLMVRSRRRRA